MSFHEGSNWQANKEDKKEPLYNPLDRLTANVDKSKHQLSWIQKSLNKTTAVDEIGLLFEGDRELAVKCVKLFKLLSQMTPLEISDVENNLIK